MGTVFFTIILLLVFVASLFVFKTFSKRAGATKDQLQAHADSSDSYSETKRESLMSKLIISNIVRWSVLAAGLLSVVLLISMCFTTVSAKNVGVAVNFGAVSQNTLSPGIQPKFPWTKVIEIDGTIQTDAYKGESCVKVTIGDGSQACATITNRWQVIPKNAASIYEQHRSDDPTQSFRSAVVSTELEQSISEALKEYNPISQLKIVGENADASDVSFVPDYGTFSKMIEDDMKERLARTGQAEIVGITFSHLELSPNTQRKLDDYISEVGATRIALQSKETARAQADANRELSSSVSNDPNVLVSRCLDFIRDAAQTGYALPAGFSCWPGGGSAIVVPKG